MTRAALAVALLLALVIAAPSLRAQQAGAPEPVIQVSIDPPRVVVGQKTTLRVEVLAPNYMTSPPVLPDFQVRNAVTRQLQSLNRNERRGDTSYAGVRFEYAIYPQEPGAYAIADQKLTIKYAAEPPRSREVTLPLPHVEFQAYIPDAAASLDPFIAATKLTIEQMVERSSDALKVGDAVTRVVTIKAEGAPAMLLPPARFTTADGLALYPAQPSLQDRTDSRTDVLSATRVDSATYMLQRAGDYLLPAIEVRWWNVRDQKIETAHLDTIAITVAANPAVQTSTPQESVTRWDWDALFDWIARHWLLGILAIVALAVVAWIAPRAIRTLALHYRLRRAAYRESETCAFRHLRAIARAGDPSAVYFALFEWLQRFEALSPSRTVLALKVAAQDPLLEADIGAMEARLFGPSQGSQDWSTHHLIHRLGIARRRLQRLAARGRSARPLPHWINPVDDGAGPTRRWRRPAR
jgi:BatD DUF11 like domain